MRKMSVILLFFYSLCLISCHLQENRREIKNLKKQNSIILKFYPTGVVNDVRYSISVIGDSFVVKNSSPINISENKEYVALLSKDQVNKIDTLVSSIKLQYRDTVISEDTWGVTLLINNQIFYEVGDFSFKRQPEEVKNLINYLVGLSAIKIELYGFS